MKAQDIMTTNPACCTPDHTAQEAARMMDDQHCGCIPVVSDQESMRLLGVVTDRDLAIRGLARGASANTLVRDLMSTDVSCCRPDDDLETVERIMADRQVRRVPVVDQASHCVGMIAQADLARASGGPVSPEEVAEVVESISRPTADPRADADVGIRIGKHGVP